MTHMDTAHPLAAEPVETLASLHYRIGKLVEDRPGVIASPSNPWSKPWDSNERRFDGLALDCCVRPVSGAGQHEIDLAREGMGEERWAALNAEWDRAQGGGR